MLIFFVKYVVGTGDGRNFVAPPGRRKSWEVDAENRAVAYVKAYRHFHELHLDVTVAPREGGQALGFSDEEVRIVQDSRVPFVDRLPRGAGVQIEEILPKV